MGIFVKSFDITFSGRAWANESVAFYQLFDASPSSNLIPLKPDTLTNHLTSVQFTRQVGFATGNQPGASNPDSGVILCSEDGGLSWDSVSWLPGIPLRLSFSKEYTGLLATGFEISILYRTTDGGFTWTQLPHTLGSIQELKLFLGGIAYVFNSTSLFRSADFASTIESVHLPADIQIYGFYFLDANRLFAYGQQNGSAAISGSEDDGTNWINQVFSFSEIIWLQMVKPDDGIAQVLSGEVYHIGRSAHDFNLIYYGTTHMIFDLGLAPLTRVTSWRLLKSSQRI